MKKTHSMVATHALKLLSGLVLAFAFAAPASTAADLSKVRTPALDWQPCEEFPEVECATARVPLDYDHPDGPKTSLALARIRSSDQARRIGTLFLNPGGPGGPGTDLIFGGFGAFLDSHLKGRFDIIGFDPRGVGDSEPLHCFKTGEAENEFLGPLPYFPYERRMERPFFKAFSSLAERCFARKQRIINHMSTADVVRDLDLLRKAVGDARLNFFGYSYGTYIGNTYANMFPDKVRALVLDGVLDPRLWSHGAQIISDRVATAEEFEQFLRLCDEAPNGCALSGPRGAAHRYWKLLKALRDEPLVFPDGSLYSYDFLIADSVSAMYTPEFWPDYAGFFAFLADAALGDPNAPAQANALRQSILERLEPLRQENYPNFLDAYYGNQCADTQYPRTLPVFSAVGEYAEDGSIFGPFWWWNNTPCARWPVSPDRYIGPWSVTTSSPVLVIGNYYDGVTGYSGAIASSKLLKGSRLLTYAGWGHTATGRNDCVATYVAAYILRGTLPKVGTVCPANPNPFEVVALGRAAPKVPLIGLPPPWR